MVRLPWTCTHCGTRHDTDEEETSCARRVRSVNRMAMFVLFVIGVCVVSAMVAHASFVYGDWTCAFAECRKVIK